MNSFERRMQDILMEGREKYGFLGVKAEFEAEGTRTDELLRLLEIARRAQVKVGLKIGGCEAIRDLIECKQFGVDYVIAPMIESPYALSKFIEARNKVFNEDEQHGMKFLFNLETISAYEHLNELVEPSNKSSGSDGIVFGRVDFAGSLGKTRGDIETDVITNYVIEAAKRCKEHHFDLVVGGGISLDSLPALRKIKSVHLDRFETRKVIFSSDILEHENIEKALIHAIEFELLWLKNKRDYYTCLGKEDDKRIEMLETRFNALCDLISQSSSLRLPVGTLVAV